MSTASILLFLASLCCEITPVTSQHAHFIPNPRMIGGVSPPQDRHPYIVSLTYFGAHLCGKSSMFLWIDE